MMGSLAYKEEKIRSPVLKGWMRGECEAKQTKKTSRKLQIWICSLLERSGWEYRLESHHSLYICISVDFYLYLLSLEFHYCMFLSLSPTPPLLFFKLFCSFFLGDLIHCPYRIRVKIWYTLYLIMSLYGLY